VVYKVTTLFCRINIKEKVFPTLYVNTFDIIFTKVLSFPSTRLIVFCNFSYVFYEVETEFLKQYVYQYPERSGARGGVVVKALRYKSAGRGFDSRWCHWNFSLT
jgi:hypothetical protein